MSVEFMAIDVRVLTHPKMVRAIARGGGDVVWLWLGLLSWTHEHDGAELPKDCVSVVSGPGPDRKRKNLLAVLTECGLIDESETGFRPHDFDLWEAGAGSYIVRRTERERKKAQRKAGRTAKCPGHVPDNAGTTEGQSPDMSHRAVPDSSGTCPPRAPARVREIRPDQNGQDQDPPVAPQGDDNVSGFTLEAPGTVAPDPVRQVFDHWAAVLWPKVHDGGRAPLPAEDRMRHIRARIADGYSVEQLCAVVDRAAADPFTLGQNDRRTAYIEPKTIMRNASKVDDFLAKPIVGDLPRPPAAKPAPIIEDDSWRSA